MTTPVQPIHLHGKLRNSLRGAPLVLLLLSACSTGPIVPRVVVDDGLTAPVEEVDNEITTQLPNYTFDDGTAADIADVEAGRKHSRDTDQRSEPARRAPKGTVVALLSQARYQQNAGNPERAAAVLERALRIDPKNARLWYELARVRLLQGKLSLAESLATKSNALAGHDEELREDNGRIIDAVQQQRQTAD
jgi:predicted Zn-dependent protease